MKTTAGEIPAGHDYPKQFHVEIIGKVIKVEEKITEIEASLSEKLEKTTDIFKHTHQMNAKGRKRSQKENRRKAKKHKTSRHVDM